MKKLLTLALATLAVSCSAATATAPTTATEPTSTAISSSLEEMMAARQLAGAPTERWQQALEQDIGSEVRWSLLSWGGEITSAPSYATPPDGPRGQRRIRLVSLELGSDATLNDVAQQGHPVVACLENDLADPDAQSPSYTEVLVEGRIWGVVAEGSFPILWLRTCEIAVVPAQ